MQMIYRDAAGKHALIDAGELVGDKSLLIGLVREGAIELVIPVERVDANQLRQFAEEFSLGLPPDFPKEAAIEVNSDIADVSFDSVKTAWKKAFSGTFRALKNEFENSESAHKALNRAATGLKGAGERVGSKAEEGIKPTFISSSNKAIVGVLSMVHRDLLSLKARLTEEALTSRLDAMNPQERRDFNALYLEKMNSSEDARVSANLTSWNKVIRRFMH